ncbi:unnamed protein product [Pylaiella littoralis]
MRGAGGSMMSATPAATTRASGVKGFMLTIALAVCSYGGGALGFVLPSASSSLMAAAAARGERTAVNTHGAATATVAAPARARPRSPFRLYAGEKTDFMDSIGGVGRELSTEEKIAALQKEVQAQAAMASEADEEEEEGEEEGEGGSGERGGDMAIPALKEEKEAEMEESSAAGFFSKDEDFSPEEGFVDEGKNILWPNPRRAAQLTLLAVVAQIAFIVYIIGLNAFLNAFPVYFQKFIDMVKSGDISQVRLPDL